MLKAISELQAEKLVGGKKFPGDCGPNYISDAASNILPLVKEEEGNSVIGEETSTNGPLIKLIFEDVGETAKETNGFKGLILC